MSKLSVQLVTWNGAKYAPYLFDSLRKQTYQDWELYILDNDSRDGMIQAMKKELNTFSVQYRLIELKENIGFAGGHNSLFRNTDSEYILLLNQDMYLRPDCLEKLIGFLDKHPTAAAVAPRLMKWDFEMIEANQRGDEARINAENLKKSFSNKVDALGLKVFRSRRVVEQYTGWDWNDLAGTGRDLSLPSYSVFGVSGALSIYRRSALQAVAFASGDVFDENYHSYKEDVDLAYRLVAQGYESYVLLDTVAYHDRAGAGPKEMADRNASINKRKQSAWVRYHSYKNHLITLYKNEYSQNFILDFFQIIWYELKKFMWFLVFDRHVLTGLMEIVENRTELQKKQIEIKAKRKVSWREMRKWISHD